MNIRYLQILVIFSFLSITNLVPQERDMVFEHITVSEGLPQNFIRCIIQDHLGFLWFTTQNGLVKYDGYSFKTYLHEPEDSSSIPTNEPIAVLEDHLGDLWMSSLSEGLIKLERETEKFTQYKHDEMDSTSIIADEVFVLYEDNANILWIGTIHEGLEKFNRETETFTHFRNDSQNINSISSNSIRAISEDNEGNLWFGTNYGLNKFNKETKIFTRYFNEPGNNNSLINNQVHEIIEDQSKNIWFATAGGLSKYISKENLWINYVNHPNESNSLSGNYLSFVFEDSKKRIWVGSTSRGLNLYDPKVNGFKHFNADPNNPNSLNSDYIYSMNEDRTGVLWIGSWISGLNKLDLYNQMFKHYKNFPGIKNSLNNNWIWCMYTDRKGIVWIGTRGGGLNSFDCKNETFNNYMHDDDDTHSISNNSVHCIFEDNQSNLWIGTSSGVDKFYRKSNKFMHYSNNSYDLNSITPGSVTSIVEDTSKNLWIGTWLGGLNKITFDNNKSNAVVITRYQHNPYDSSSLSDNGIHKLFIDSFGSLWIATNRGGLDKFNSESESFQHFYNRGERFDAILTMYEDKLGRFWVGTKNGGLNLLDRSTGKRKVFDTKSGLPHNSIKDILEDKFGNIWISTEKGLSRFNSKKNSFRNYSVSDGLQSDFFNTGAATIGKDGYMYFGGINGFNRFYPENINDNPYPPQVVISDIKLFDSSLSIGGNSPLKKHINIAEKIELNYNQNDITLEYVGLHFSKSEVITYRFQLENYDKNWRFAGNNRIANYTNLKPGEYIFRVNAISSNGITSKSPASLKIIIVPPFWQTIWFKTLGIFFLLVLLLTGYKMRVKQLNKKRELLEERVAERTEVAQKLEAALGEVEKLKDQLHEENIYLQSELKVEHNFENIISTSEEFNKVLNSVEQVASTDSTVLILGETGTGKELLARAIHSISQRSGRALVKVNCATLPDNLIESELFGHDKGAFTGATSRKVGRFELANNGTIFLDEIGELPLELQPKLLRVLQEGEFELLGNPKTIKVDVRIIASTNRNLEKAVKEGSFRKDLYYRLNVFPIIIPPLRERKSDIPSLVKHFVDKYSSKIGRVIQTVAQNDVDRLMKYSWPGNVRELENIIERAVITTKTNKLTLGDWLSNENSPSGKRNNLTLDEVERDYIIQVLESTNWRVSGPNGAAKILGLIPQTLEHRMKKLNIHRS